MEHGRNHRRHWTGWVYRLELYELVGACASVAAVIVFFAFANRLDARMGITGYHWRVVANLVALGRSPLTWAFVVVMGALLVAMHHLRASSRPGAENAAYVLRVLASFCVLMGIYRIVNAYITVFDPFDRDTILWNLDRAWFGQTPAAWFDQMAPLPWLTWLMNAAYLSWYIMTCATILCMLAHSRGAAMAYVFTAILTFYLGYIGYVLVPAVGPLYTVPFRHALGGLTEWFLQQRWLALHDCFPSLHTAISVVMWTFVWRYRRRLVWLYTPLCSLIILSTMYLRFHYGVDVIAGLALAGVTTQVGPLAVAAWERRRQQAASATFSRRLSRALHPWIRYNRG
ncbi:MAG: phosphatase PAP2 family protein [Thermoflavifilum sp.]|nr:phosphatase PAP2 family protein [Thermoflavifilum sp.]MCL6513628.1 phosphatase PAP2 family protein [Alicyclobacillus sp.]